MAGLVVAMSGCGAGQRAAPITVGNAKLSHAVVAGFARAIKAGSTFPWLSAELPTPTEQAAALVIRYRWLIGEAVARGVAVSTHEAAGALHSRAAATLGGASEFQATLRQTAETAGQAQLVVMAELSAERLRRKIAQSLREEATPHEIISYYRSHASRFTVPEERFFNLAERIDNRQELASASRALVQGHVVPGGGGYEAEFKESLARDLIPKLNGDRGAFVRAIFAARLGAVSKPYRYFGQKAIFRVTRVVPGFVRPLREVSAAIARQLHAENLAHARAAFLRSWRSRWTAVTECARGYVVPGCKEFHGPSVHEEQDPLSPE